MADFAAQLDKFVMNLKRRNQVAFVRTVSAVQESVVNGSAVTGAPGQRVDTGFLRDSWQVTFESPSSARITTNVAYAPCIEENTRAAYNPSGVTRPPEYEAKSNRRRAANRKGLGNPNSPLPEKVGGFHSVALTIAGFQLLVDEVVAGIGG